MLNYSRQFVRKYNIEIICLIFLFWAPHIGLDYIFDSEGGEKLQLPNGQYVFFFSSLLACIGLLRIAKFGDLRLVLACKTIWVGVVLLLLGIFLSSTGVWGWRLTAIVALCSMMSLIAANSVVQSGIKIQLLASILLMIPFAVPVFGAVFLEIFGPLDVGFELANVTHIPGSRWRFLNMSANGFGFDAAFVCSFLVISTFFTKNIFIRLVLILASLVSFYALLQSGTRAAFVFLFVSLLAFAVFQYALRGLLFVICAVLSAIVLVFVTDNVETIKGFLRIKDTLVHTSSGRWIGILGMWRLFLLSPFVGTGFGSVDNQFVIVPSNIFYFGLLAEIGIFGFLGALVILTYPIRLAIGPKTKACRSVKCNLLVALSFSSCAGFLPYLMFEFDVFRVSVNNQLYFFFWGILFFYLAKTDVPQESLGS